MKRLTGSITPFGARPEFGHPINQGLFGRWLLNEGAGAIAFDCVRKNNGSLNGVFKTMQMGNSASLAGTPNLISVTSKQSIDNLCNAGSPITISAWVYNTSIGGTSRAIVCKMHTINDQGLLFFYINTSGKLVFQITDGNPSGSESYTCTTGTLSANQWYHVVVTHIFGTGTSTRVYNNGVLCTGAWAVNGNRSVNSSSTLALEFGHLMHVSFPNWFLGYMKDIIIWNRILLQQEVQQLYTNPNIGLIL